MNISTGQVVSVVHWGIGLAMTVVGSLETAHVFAGSTLGGAILAAAGPMLIAVERYLSSTSNPGTSSSASTVAARPAPAPPVPAAQPAAAVVPPVA